MVGGMKRCGLGWNGLLVAGVWRPCGARGDFVGWSGGLRPRLGFWRPCGAPNYLCVLVPGAYAPG